MPGFVLHRGGKASIGSQQARIGAQVVELHAGAYCDAHNEGRIADRDRELDAIVAMAEFGASIGLEIHAGHGLTFDTVKPVAALPEGPRN